MNASEFSYWYRSGHGPLFGSQSMSSDPVDVFYSADSRFFGVNGGRIEATGSWRGSPDTAQRSIENASNRLTDSPVFIYRQKGKDRVWTFGISIGKPSSSMSRAPWQRVSVMNMPSSDEDILSMISFQQNVYGAVDRIECSVDSIAAEGERFGGKEERLERLEDALLSLEESLEESPGKNPSKIARKISRTKRKIARLQRKLGIQPEEEAESMGLYSSHSFLPAELEDHSSNPGALGVRRAGAFGQAPSLRGEGFSFGFSPADPAEGPYQLWPSDAATVNRGTIVTVPVFPEGSLSSSAEEGALQGVDEFLSSRRACRR